MYTVRCRGQLLNLLRVKSVPLDEGATVTAVTLKGWVLVTRLSGEINGGIALTVGQQEFGNDILF